MISAGLFSSDCRIFPGSRLRMRNSFPLDGARGERRSCQVYLENTGMEKAVTCRLDAIAPEGVHVRTRRTGGVTIPHHNTDTPASDLDGLGRVPGVVPDILYNESELVVSSGGTGVFWITVEIESDAHAGQNTVELILDAEGKATRLSLDVEVYDINLAPRSGLPVTHWFYSDALLDWYKLDGFEERYWGIVAEYMRNLLEHGNDVLYVPLFSPTTDGDRRPSQLLCVSETFDWTMVTRYIELARSIGFSKFEWPHLFSQWGASRAIRVYDGQGRDEKLLWSDDTPATSDRYRTFLSRFLPEFKSFLDKNGILEGSFFHVSDEPSGDEDRRNYTASRAMLQQLAPWMKTMDAVSELGYGKDQLTDIPIPQLGSAMDYVNEGIDCFAYFCCHPRHQYINRLLDTPLHKIRMLGWVLYRHRQYIHGFLHWGYNYWYRSQTRELVDPFSVTDAGAWPGWAYGDPFVVYPGADGPLDSIRWEAFAEGLAEYQLLETVGLAPDADVLANVRDFSTFPRNPTWRSAARRKVLNHGVR
jgi:hypothetical protein